MTKNKNRQTWCHQDERRKSVKIECSTWTLPCVSSANGIANTCRWSSRSALAIFTLDKWNSLLCVEWSWKHEKSFNERSSAKHVNIFHFLYFSSAERLISAMNRKTVSVSLFSFSPFLYMHMVRLSVYFTIRVCCNFNHCGLYCASHAERVVDYNITSNIHSLSLHTPHFILLTVYSSLFTPLFHSLLLVTSAAKKWHQSSMAMDRTRT